jgi:hypothetical protein
MDQYKARGKGADRQYFLSAWAGEPWSVHRKNQNDEPVFVPHPFVSVTGGMPPGLLNRLRGEKAIIDGFVDRILFCYPEPPHAIGETWAAMADGAAECWHKVLECLWALEQDQDGGTTSKPRLVRMNSDGRQVWKGFTDRLAAEVNADGFPECLVGPWAKFKGYCARLALIVHFLRLATGETEAEEIDGQSLERAALLVRYFQSHARKIYAVIDADQATERAKRILQWIKREQRSQFRRWEPFKDLRNQTLFPKLETINEPLDRLTKHNFIRQIPTQERKGAGRPQATAFEVNPLALTHAENPINPTNCRFTGFTGFTGRH